jgi:hypothetical protein
VTEHIRRRSSWELLKDQIAYAAALRFKHYYETMGMKKELQKLESLRKKLSNEDNYFPSDVVKDYNDPHDTQTKLKSPSSDS